MAFTLTEFGTLRPFLFHLTAAANLPRIQRTGRLESAAQLAQQAGRGELLDARRRAHVPLTLGDETVWLRDQAPLHQGNMALDDGWTFAQFVAHLNARVFFWPGGPHGPIDYGARHFGRYAAEAPVLLRVRVASLIGANADLDLQFSRCNSGSPRYNRGVAGPRGGQTFRPARDAAFQPRQVVEVTAPGSVRLPDDSEWGTTLSGPWLRLR